LLTPRPPKGKKPVRIVLDANLQIPLSCKLLRTAKRLPIVIVTDKAAAEANPTKVRRIEKKGAELVYVPTSDGKCDLEAVVIELGRRGVAQLIVEGGAEVITSFLKGGVADAVKVYIAPKILGQAGAVSITESMAQLVDAASLHYVTVSQFEGDVCISGLLKEMENQKTQGIGL